MASIDFTDSTGAASLTNGKSGGPARFSGWTPFELPFGPKAEALGTGIPFRWRHRTDYGASFSLEAIPNSSQDVVMRLIAHLENGGSVTVNTGDTSSRSYTTCYLAPGTNLANAYVLSDRRTIEYTLSLTLMNAGGAQMLCIY